MKKITIFIVGLVFSVFTLCSASASTFGCQFFLCIMGGVSNGGDVCVDTVNEVISDLKKGKPMPTCPEAGAADIRQYTASERLVCSKGNLELFGGGYTCTDIVTYWDTESGTYRKKKVSVSKPNVVQEYTRYYEYDFGYLSEEHKLLADKYSVDIIQGIQKTPIQLKYGSYYDPSGRLLGVH